MTITSWQDPKPEVIYLRQNIHSYLSGVEYTPQLGMMPMLMSFESTPKSSHKK